MNQSDTHHFFLDETGDHGLSFIDANFTIISVAIDKKRHIEKYGKLAQNPYSICLSSILEQLIFCLDQNPDTTVVIDIEKRGRKEDAQLLAHYNKVIDLGTLQVSSDDFKKHIINFNMKLKKDNDIGLQIADLCAYPIARHILNSEEPYIPFKMIENKLRENKVFP